MNSPAEHVEHSAVDTTAQAGIELQGELGDIEESLDGFSGEDDIQAKDAHGLVSSIKSGMSRALKRVLRQAQKATNVVLYTSLYPRYYSWCARKPIRKGSVVFVEPMAAELSNSLGLLHQRLSEDHRFQVEAILLGHLRTRYAKRAWENFGVIRRLATAENIFIANSFPTINVCPLRSETKLIQTWHGCGAFKRFGFSIKNESSESLTNYSLFKLHSNYTHVLVSGDEAVGPYADAMNMADRLDRIYPVGVSRTDRFWDEELKQSAYQRLYDTVPQAKGKTVVLYCPTYRGKTSKAKFPSGFDIELLAKHFSDRFVFLIKRHPFVKKQTQIPEGLEDFAVDVSDVMTIDELVFVSDVCVSDYSSVVFEFSLFDRPIYFFAPDLDEYYDKRGFYYDYDAFACGPVCIDSEQLVEALSQNDSFDLDQVRDFRRRFMNGCDGHSTERIIDLIFGQTPQDHVKKAGS